MHTRQRIGQGGTGITQGVLTILENLIIFMTPVDIEHMLFITTGSTGNLSQTY